MHDAGDFLSGPHPTKTSTANSERGAPRHSLLGRKVEWFDSHGSDMGARGSEQGWSGEDAVLAGALDACLLVSMASHVSDLRLKNPVGLGNGSTGSMSRFLQSIPITWVRESCLQRPMTSPCRKPVMSWRPSASARVVALHRLSLGPRCVQGRQDAAAVADVLSSSPASIMRREAEPASRFGRLPLQPRTPNFRSSSNFLKRSVPD